MICDCICYTDASGRELAVHGNALLPAASYEDDLLQWPVSWHWHEELEAGIIAGGGAAILGVGSRRERVKTGQGFFINAGILHNAIPESDAPATIHSIVFHPRLVGGSPESVFWQKYLLPLTQSDAFEFALLEAGDSCLESLARAWEAFSNEEEGYEFTLRSGLSQVVYRVFTEAPSRRQHVSEKTLRDNERVKRMLQYIQQNYAEAITIAQIAASAAISKTECLRCFRSVLATTPIQYLKAYRLQIAAGLLETTNLKVSEIGAACGFSEMSYFARSFRQSRGCTPVEYREERARRTGTA